MNCKLISIRLYPQFWFWIRFSHAFYMYMPHINLCVILFVICVCLLAFDSLICVKTIVFFMCEQNSHKCWLLGRNKKWHEFKFDLLVLITKIIIFPLCSLWCCVYFSLINLFRKLPYRIYEYVINCQMRSKWWHFRIISINDIDLGF